MTVDHQNTKIPGRKGTIFCHNEEINHVQSTAKVPVITSYQGSCL